METKSKCKICYSYNLVRFYVCIAIILLSVHKVDSLNNRPIIGVLSHELSSKNLDGSYIAASYIKFLEGGGARVVPILINKKRPYYEHLVNSINGILFPGGAADFNISNGYADAGHILYHLAVKLNQANDYFPIWGTCLGFELMTYVAANRREHRINCWSYNQALSLNFKPDFRESRLFGSCPNDVIHILSHCNITGNFHELCVTERNLTAFNLDAEWHVLSTNFDAHGLEFISSMESRYYPFYAVIFHPEKNAYEWKQGKNYPHCCEAIKAMQYFANFFVNEARKNSHRFPTMEEERAALIYNFAPVNTYSQSVFDQTYFFS